jgi:DNA-binding PadR family transcriptional regulator
MAKDRLSDLEHTVLGIVWRDGPCTPYAVRSQFQRSPSSHWSGSAGSIYPVVERLQRRKLLRSSAQSQGKRASRAYTVTEEGRRTLVTWLRPPLPDEAVAVHFDAIRTRTFFLGALTPKQRERFLDDAAEKLREGVETARRYVDEVRASGDELGWLAARGGLLMTRARLAWVVEMRQHLFDR